MSDALAMKCKSCGHCWEEQLALPMELDAFATYLTRLSCPRCGVQSLQCLFGAAAKAAPPRAGGPA
jgi:hypothetical protein